MPKRPLYFMIKPPPDVAQAIAALPQAARRAPGLLHITLMPLGDRLLSPRLADLATAIGDAIQDVPFRVVFDLMAGSGRTLALCGSEPMRGAHKFQALIFETMTRHGLSIEPLYRFAPHITINYRSAIRGTEAIDPISWRVGEFLLVESVVGESRHIELGRWPLRA